MAPRLAVTDGDNRLPDTAALTDTAPRASGDTGRSKASALAKGPASLVLAVIFRSLAVGIPSSPASPPVTPALRPAKLPIFKARNVRSPRARVASSVIFRAVWPRTTADPMASFTLASKVVRGFSGANRSTAGAVAAVVAGALLPTAVSAGALSLPLFAEDAGAIRASRLILSNSRLAPNDGRACMANVTAPVTLVPPAVAAMPVNCA